MRRRLHILALLPALLASAMWARSHWHFDFAVAHGWTLGSESGSFYAFDGGGTEAYYVSGSPRGNGHLEFETGSAYRPWLPLWTWRNNGDRFVVVQWWAITAAGSVLAWWVWRRRKDATRGFEVSHLRRNRST